MNIGFLSLPLTGRLNPILAFARRMQTRGHEVPSQKRHCLRLISRLGLSFGFVFGWNGLLAAQQGSSLEVSASQIVPIHAPAAALRSLIRTDSPVIAITHVTLFNGTGSPATRDQTVIMDHEIEIGTIRSGRQTKLLLELESVIP
jgi:hypothetical protein